MHALVVALCLRCLCCFLFNRIDQCRNVRVVFFFFFITVLHTIHVILCANHIQEMKSIREKSSKVQVRRNMCCSLHVCMVRVYKTNTVFPSCNNTVRWKCLIKCFVTKSHRVLNVHLFFHFRSDVIHNVLHYTVFEKKKTVLNKWLILEM